MAHSSEQSRNIRNVLEGERLEEAVHGEASDRLHVLYFCCPFCSKCYRTDTDIVDAAELYPTVSFLACDISLQHREPAREMYGVCSAPAVVLIRGGQLIKRVRAPTLDKIIKAIENEGIAPSRDYTPKSVKKTIKKSSQAAKMLLNWGNKGPDNVEEEREVRDRSQ